MVPNCARLSLEKMTEHLSSLIAKAEGWPKLAQTHLYSFWSQFDTMSLLWTFAQPSLEEGRMVMCALWDELEALEQLPFANDDQWHVDELRKALIIVSTRLDEHLCRSFELPVLTSEILRNRPVSSGIKGDQL
jgi:hypothetical protein